MSRYLERLSLATISGEVLQRCLQARVKSKMESVTFIISFNSKSI